MNVEACEQSRRVALISLYVLMFTCPLITEHTLRLMHWSSVSIPLLTSVSERSRIGQYNGGRREPVNVHIYKSEHNLKTPNHYTESLSPWSVYGDFNGRSLCPTVTHPHSLWIYLQE